jgi:hypothetical protein
MTDAVERPQNGGGIMKFLLIARYAEQAQPLQTPKAMMDAMERLMAEGFSEGWLKDMAGLKPPSESARIRAKGGKLTVIDGPFTEAKEMIGGYAIVETRTREEAIEIALRFMELRRIHDPDFEYESEVLATEDS